MILKNSFRCLLLSCFFASCSPAPPIRNKDLERQLWGPWQSGSLRLTMNTFNNRDTTKVFEVDEASWERKMNMRPFHTIYFGDGSFVSTQRNLKDSVLYSPAGTWRIMGDTLFMKDTFPEVGLPYKYRIEIKGKIAEISGMEDCDNDGKADDEYYGTLRRQQR